MNTTENQEEYSLNFGFVKIELWIFILAINIILFIGSYVSYRIIFFYGYQVSLDKTLNILQKSSKDYLFESENKE